jgi:hypothetical protein
MVVLGARTDSSLPAKRRCAMRRTGQNSKLRKDELHQLNPNQLLALAKMDDSLTEIDLWLIHDVLAAKLEYGDQQSSKAMDGLRPLLDVRRRSMDY